LAALLGHATVQMTSRYVHPTDAHKADAAKKLETYLKNPAGNGSLVCSGEGEKAGASESHPGRFQDCQAAHTEPRLGKDFEGVEGWRQYRAPNGPGSPQEWFGKS
jgi:hypothetical protein